MKKIHQIILLFGVAAILILPGCGARQSLDKDSGRSLKMIFHVQAKKRSSMKVAPLTATEALMILDRYESSKGRRKGRGSARSSGDRPKASGPMTRLKRIE